MKYRSCTFVHRCRHIAKVGLSEGHEMELGKQNAQEIRQQDKIKDKLKLKPIKKLS